MNPIAWIFLGVLLILATERLYTGIPLSQMFKIVEHERRRLHNEKLRKEKKKEA